MLSCLLREIFAYCTAFIAITQDEKRSSSVYEPISFAYGDPTWRIKTISIPITFRNVLLDKKIALSYHARVLHDRTFEVLII